MTGKFHVWGDGKNVYIVHGADVTEETEAEHRSILVGAHGPGKGNHLADLMALPVTPSELRTGVCDPASVWLPREVFLAMVVRVYEDHMTQEERDASRGRTRWEHHVDDQAKTI